MMDAEKYNRTISLLCPTCGTDRFSYEDEHNHASLAKCACCGFEMTINDLMRANGENIEQHVSEVKKALAKDIEKELADTLKKAFRGNKFITIK